MSNEGAEWVELAESKNFTFQEFGNGIIVEFEPDSLKVCASWLLLPGENLWGAGIRGFLYILFMFYLFIGIAIISDIFMGAIEVITSKKKVITRFDPITNEANTKEVLVWNETVANLSLMALGSSAPEILLAFVEQLGLLASGVEIDINSEIGGLGTFTIIGSAAFNLLVITGICIFSPAKGEIKRIEQFGVFCTTALWSVFAYVWILIVLQYNSPNEVELWEAVVTFLFFPALILHAWAQDNNWWCIGKKAPFMVKLLTTQKKKGQLPMFHPDSNEHLNKNHENHNDVEKADDTPAAPVGASKWAALRNAPDAAEEPSGESAAKPNPWVKLLDKNSEVQGVEGDPSHQGPTTALARSRVTETSALSRSRFRHAVLSSMMGTRRVTPKLITSASSTKASKPPPKIATLVEVLREARRKETELQRLSAIRGFFYFHQKMCNIMHDQKELVLDVTYQPNPSFRPKAEEKAEDKVKKEEDALADSPEAEDITALIQDGTLSKDFQCTYADSNYIHFSTRDGSAKKNLDYEPVSGVLEFKEGEIKKQIRIPILHHEVESRQEEFNVILENPSKETDLGDPSICTVTILDMSRRNKKWTRWSAKKWFLARSQILARIPTYERFIDHGTISVDSTRYHSDANPGEISIGVKRSGGSDGAVAISYRTIDATAIGGDSQNDGSDYIKLQGTLWFRHGEAAKTIDLVINPNAHPLQDHSTLIVALQRPLLGATLGEECAMVITICKTEGCRESRDEALLAEIAGNYDDEDKPLKEAYLEQFTSALTMGGEVDEDGEEEEPSIGDLIMHFIALFWKVLFSIVPPRFCGSGYPAFVVSLFFIGVLTAIVEQIASLLGCVWGIKQAVSGITLVALGTSLPDTFASRSAAIHDDSADAAIGNVTGSNSVNVFLGLGLPWLLAVFWKKADQSGPFMVGTFNLEFSVILFVMLALFALLTLILRRVILGGELGGSTVVKFMTGSICLLLWSTYIIVASLKAYGIINIG
ncbi:sodium/calcium exchanger 2-like isoform X7 [Bolinopsis microptera]|uniref:sodium/calcium exchanger 2-like isoform X7 n=1 Tax=Bolinopsis microptera TaxID=2820187 RepID=UPI003079AD78